MFVSRFRRRPRPALAAALVLCLAATVPVLAADPTPYPQTRVIDTKLSFGDLVTSLDAAVKANGMFVVMRASASGGAAKRGITIAGNMVVGVYRNDFAVRMLEASVAGGIEAPLRFYLTENADGTATLTYRAPSAVFAPYDSPRRARVPAAAPRSAASPLRATWWLGSTATTLPCACSKRASRAVSRRLYASI